MEVPSKLLEQIAFKTRRKLEEHMFIVLGKYAHEEHLSQPLKRRIKYYKIAATTLTGCNGIFNVTTKQNESPFPKINY